MKTALMAALLCASFLVDCIAEVRRDAYLMGTRVTLRSHAPDRNAGLAELARLLRILEESDRELSTWLPESQISRLNSQPIGAPFGLNPLLCPLFGKLQAWAARTEGAFDPATGTLVEAWSLHAEGRRPSPEDLGQARENSGFGHIRLDAAGCALTRDRAVRIDVGAFGKGEALDRAWVYSDRTGPNPWLIDLGGQIMVFGTPLEGFWEVAVAHPVDRERPALLIELRQGSLATSGGSERDIVVGGERIGHVLDPRTGMTIQSNVAVTVWHARALDADILSTALYVMGPDEGLAWAEEHDVAAAFLIPEARGGPVEIRASARFAEAFLRN